MKGWVCHFVKWQAHPTHFNIQGDYIYVILKLRLWGRHLPMRDIAVNIVRASGFRLEMYAK